MCSHSKCLYGHLKNYLWKWELSIQRADKILCDIGNSRNHKLQRTSAWNGLSSQKKSSEVHMLRYIQVYHFLIFNEKNVL